MRLIKKTIYDTYLSPTYFGTVVSFSRKSFGYKKYNLFGSQRPRQIFIYVIYTEEEELRTCTWNGIT